jgi:light-regulated signal transduction histidine kinase (bacteriophytochrome)
LIEIFYSFSCDQNFQIRKIAAKNLKNLVGNVKDNPPTLTKIVGGLLNDREDLIKLLALDGAIVYFPENPLLVLESLKSMLTVNSWRINMKIC